VDFFTGLLFIMNNESYMLGIKSYKLLPFNFTSIEYFFDL